LNICEDGVFTAPSEAFKGFGKICKRKWTTAAIQVNLCSFDSHRDSTFCI